MITFDLACDQGHRFEGWFRNREDFDTQLAAGLVSCPLCGSHEVEKKLSAVSVHVGRRSAPTLPPRPPRPPGDAATAGGDTGDAGDTPAGVPAAAVPQFPSAPQAKPFFQALSQFIETHFEDVGSRFAEEARKVDSGETEVRNIRGTTTPQEEEELREDGVEFLKVSVPKYDA
jgi:hypothetical protein